jgi:hypothetical protein
MLLLPIKWFILQCLIFLVMVAIEAAILHYVEGIAKRDSIIYMFLVNLFSFNFGWLLISIVFRALTATKVQDEILSYMLLGIVSEKLLNNVLVSPFENPLLVVMMIYFGAVFYFELKAFTLLRVFILPTGEPLEELILPISPWLDRLLVFFLSKDLRLVVTIFMGNVISHGVVAGLIFLTQA